MTIVNIINLFVIVLYVVSITRFYNKRTEYFFSMLIISVYWTQLLVSSSYIETGVYLKDIGKTSYATGVTLRLFLMIELMLGVISYCAGRHPRRAVVNPQEGELKYKNFRYVLGMLFIMYVYRLVDVIVSGNILTNVSVTRFNYFSDYSTLPFAQVIDYFSYPCLWILGYILLLGENKKQKTFPIVIFAMNLAAVFLRGVEFGGFLQSTLYFMGPMLLTLARGRKLIKIKYVAAAALLLVVMLVPKYNHFSDSISKGYADKSYGLETAYDFLMYRMLAQEADLTWELDRQIWEDGEIDPGRYEEIIKEVLGVPVEKISVQYLMDKGCSSSALAIYARGNALVTGGYPMIWAYMFGYLFSIPFIIIDAYLLFLVIRCICEGMAKQRMFLLLAGGYLLCQCYTVVICGNFSTMGNTIPHIFIILLLLIYKRPLLFQIGNKKCQI